MKRRAVLAGPLLLIAKSSWAAPVKAKPRPRLIALDPGHGGHDPGAQGNDIVEKDLVLDVALNPDFSQVESDEPQTTVNRRFEVYFPEKRPFFLEGVDLLATQIPAVYTRSITSPRWGAAALPCLTVPSCLPSTPKPTPCT